MNGNCRECERRWFCDINPNDCDEWNKPVPITNAERINSMSIKDKAEFLCKIAYARETPWSAQFYKTYCEKCPTVECKIEGYNKTMDFHECDFVDGKCPYGNDIEWWLQQPAEGNN